MLDVCRVRLSAALCNPIRAYIQEEDAWLREKLDNECQNVGNENENENENEKENHAEEEDEEVDVNVDVDVDVALDLDLELELYVEAANMNVAGVENGFMVSHIVVAPNGFCSLLVLLLLLQPNGTVKLPLRLLDIVRPNGMTLTLTSILPPSPLCPFMLLLV